MSRVADLITALCPNGVEVARLDEVAGYSDTRVDASELDDTTFLGVDNLLSNRGGKVDSDHRPTTGRLTAYRPGDILLGNIRPYLKKLWLAENSGGCSGDVLAIRIQPQFAQRLSPEFLYSVLSSDHFFEYNMRHAKGAKMPRGDKAAILGYEVPLPPIEVQQEVVRTLNSFTSVHRQLQAELQAELKARRAQYIYYRDNLLAFPEGDVKQEALGDLATVVRGASPRPIQMFLTDAESGVPWIKIGDTVKGEKYITSTAEHVTRAGAAKSRLVRPGDFVLSNSMSFGRPYISKIEGYIHDGWLAISNFESSFVPDFLYHLLGSALVQAEFGRRAGAGTVRNLNADIVRSVVVPVPSLEEQMRIVGILDEFEELENEMSSSLLAEFEGRRLQYEHHRAQLLTFEGAVA